MIKPLEQLKSIAEKLNVPYDMDRYEGPEHEFAVYTMTEISGDNFADDRAQGYIASIRFDYIQPYNKPYQDKIFEIIDLMIEAGFEEPRVVVVNDNCEHRILQFTTEIVL